MTDSKEGNSHREILRSTSIIGGASVINIAIGIVRVKILALLVGPSGVGLMGILTRVLGTATAVVGMGLGHSGVRQIAASSDPVQLARTRRALWYANLALGLLGLLLVWLLREPIALWVFEDAARAPEVGWLGVGVLLSLVSASQTALLQGLRRIADLARVTIVGVFTGSLVGVVLVWQLGEAGIVWMLLVAPLASALIAARFVARVPRPAPVPWRWSELWPEWQALFALGFAVMAATLISALTQLVIRSWVTDVLGLDATGHFEAAWSISMNYIGFVLAAMATDYYPRLTAAIGDRVTANRLVNEQAEVALLLAAPVLVGIVTFAPLVTHVLYSSDFDPTIEVLRLQAVGDVLKVTAWPLGFILLARGDNRGFFLTELAWNATYLALVWLLLPAIGLAATGLAFIAAYAVYIVLTGLIVWRINGYSPQRRLVLHGGVTLVVASAILVAGYVSEWLALGLGIAATLGIGFHSLRALLRLVEVGGRLGRILARLRARNGSR